MSLSTPHGLAAACAFAGRELGHSASAPQHLHQPSRQRRPPGDGPLTARIELVQPTGSRTYRDGCRSRAST